MTEPLLRVIIADDQPLIRSALAALLTATSDIEVVAEAADGLAALDATRREMPDVVLMDIRMPHLDGLAATRAIKAELPDVAVVVLTTFDLDDYVFQAVRAGASGFLLKDGDADELVRAIRTAANGDALISPNALRRLLDEFMRSPVPDAAVTARVAALTAREREVLTLAASGLTNSEIAETLVITEATVKTHIGSILGKLPARDRVQAVIAAYASGLATPEGRPGGGERDLRRRR